MKKMYILSLILFFGFLSIAQLPNYVPTTGLVGWWALDGNGQDLSTNANHLTEFSLTATADRNNQAGKALVFNGSSSYLTKSSIGTTFSQSGNFTVSLWHQKTAYLGGVAMINGSSTNGNFIWNVQTNTTNAMFGTNKQGSSWFWANTSNYVINTWEHILATFENGTMKIYKNGTLTTTVSNTHTIVASASLPLYIGRGLSGSYFNGKLDDIGIWNRVLTSTEINQLFTSTMNTSEVEMVQIKIYPNPSTEFFTITFPKVNFGKVKIFDSNIRLIEQIEMNNQNEISFGKNYSKGLYWVQISINDKNYSYKLIKN